MTRCGRWKGGDGREAGEAGDESRTASLQVGWEVEKETKKGLRTCRPRRGSKKFERQAEPESRSRSVRVACAELIAYQISNIIDHR